MKLLHGQEQTVTSFFFTSVSSDGRSTNYIIVGTSVPTRCYLNQAGRFEVLPNPAPTMPDVVMTTPTHALPRNTVDVAAHHDGLELLVGGLVEPGDQLGEFGLLPLPSTSA